MASNDQRAPLEALPTEILQMILSRMACTEDLSAAIKASPTILRSFLGWREAILISVIQSSLSPGIFMELLGLLDVPNFGNLHYMPGPQVAHFVGLDYRGQLHWSFFRADEQTRLIGEFRREHFKRLEEGLECGAPQPFPIPRTRQSVNTVVRIFVSLKRHMEKLFNTSDVDCRATWVPGMSASEYDPMDTSSKSVVWDRRAVSLVRLRPVWRDVTERNQRSILRELLWEKLLGDG